jgi:NADPH-dependent 2,4-dienoyl-CoA reductase/sulfur reductase-like enzyme/peroxiredoxin family protein/rhodanese-related sulfurtransferase/TusA-related sulfurtransferase
MSKKIIIVGGVAGGATAAARLRRMDETAEITLLERGEYISFANCGLPYHIGGAIEAREALMVQTAEGMSEKFNIQVRPFNEAVSIDRENKQITVREVKTDRTYQENYDALILSPGASPLRPPIPGIEDAEHVFTLRNIPDTDVIIAHINDHQPNQAVVIGGGFIGVEMAENLLDKGMKVTLVEMLDQIMAPLDFEMASILHHHLREKGVRLILSDGVKSFQKQGRQILLSSGTVLETDLTVLAIGVRPESQLAAAAGLELGERGGIKVNEFMQTSDAAIYAIGDAVEVTDYINGEPAMIPLAGPANKQGRIAADHICGHPSSYPGTLGTAVVKVFDMTAASTGNNEKRLKQVGIPYQALHIHPGSHAGYYPGAFPLSMKMLYHPDSGKILGAQAVGYSGVEKRIDVLATAIQGGLTVEALQELELAYAPPYSSAKDPVNMLGFAATNLQEGFVDSFQWHEMNELLEQNAYVLDVRDDLEREIGFIEGSHHIPLNDLRRNLDTLPKDQPIYLYCQVGIRGYLASRILTQHGFSAKNLDGGYKTYQAVYRPGEGDHCTIEMDDSGVAHVTCLPESVPEPSVQINACGLQCPGPIMQVYQGMNSMQPGQVMEVSATDPGFSSDIAVWCRKTGNTLLSSTFNSKAFVCLIQKGVAAASVNTPVSVSPLDGTTIVVFSEDMDKAMASFIIASGAASMGKKVTLFFTFWGLNVLRRDHAVKVDKTILEKMFGWMMPRGSKKLPISKMNMGGMGSQMIKYVMKQKNVDSLEVLMQNAMNAGVSLVACAMSMDIMGIKESELIDGVEIGGVASYLGKAEESSVNLFI